MLVDDVVMRVDIPLQYRYPLDSVDDVDDWLPNTGFDGDGETILCKIRSTPLDTLRALDDGTNAKVF